ncbi:putative beta-glucosidase m protein [Eutypa lata UCREL1]|uniref:Beta-glucosidase cel3A n=1 Tax=Eutypa lata (strain UCR-EL1) TaxID=1287681 RepID=M7TM91_EUTLA|nr:putative beta-glucosidase m protein [Eutypa lata UCREL1]
MKSATSAHLSMREPKPPPSVPPDLGWFGRLKRRFPILQKKRGKALLIAILCLPLLALLGLLALRNRGGGAGNGESGGTSAGDTITDDVSFYGSSEPVYPSPAMTGVGAWADAYNKAVDFVKQLTIEEKVGLASGVESSTGTSGTLNSCSGNIAPISRLNFSGLCLTDAGQGVRAADFVSGFPSGIHVGASWNKALARSRAESMGLEFRVKGVNIALGPVVGPLGRVATGGRNWEGFAADPYLCGSLAYETVKGVQSQGVITSTKHFIANEQETHRQPNSDGIESVSANIDDKTMHELYLWPFQDAVYAGTGNIMCSYNRVNNSYACANSKTQNGLLKTELGFQGAVTSDWDAMHAGVASALAGMDMVMPNSELWGDKLEEAVRNGSIPEERLDDMATRIMASWYQMKQDEDFPEPGIGMPPDLSKRHDIVDARNTSAQQVLLDGAIEGHVLVKNIRGALPLREPRMLSVYGYSARNPDQWNYKPEGGIAAWTFGGESSSRRTGPYQWIDHANVTAVLFAHLPGEASGRALVSLLYGDSNPSGKLPYTVARNESDYGALLHADLPEGRFARFPQSDFVDTDGGLVDYRSFDARNATPRFEFGFGLSYTAFSYSNLRVDRAAGANVDAYPTGAVAEGGQVDLWDVLATVRADVANVGGVDGAEVAQLYLNIPGAGASNATDGGGVVRQLRGFEKPFLNVSESATVAFNLTRRDLSIWDVAAQRWRLQKGNYGVFVGASSRDIPLRGTLTL